MPPPWCTPDKGQNGAVIGEIYFGLSSISLGAGDKKELDKLAEILATFHGHVHDFDKPSLLLLGDTDAAEAPKPKPELGKSRAVAVEQYLRTKLPQQAAANVKIESAAKGGAALPGMKPPPGQPRQRVVQLINKGKAITRMAAGTKKAATLVEALQVAQQALAERPPANKNQADRIRYWVEGKGKASVEQGADAYLHGMNKTVQRQAQAGSRELSQIEMDQLKDANRIGRELMADAARGNPLDLVRDRLIGIDGGIESGIDLVFKAKQVEASTFGSSGLDQLAQFITQRGTDPSSFYHAYLGGIKQQRETANPMGTWRVKADKWTWLYEFKAGGRASWRDVVNGQSGSGRWFEEFEGGQPQMRIVWDSSENKEVWRPLPLNPDNQKGQWTWKNGTTHEIRAVREKRF